MLIPECYNRDLMTKRGYQSAIRFFRTNGYIQKMQDTQLLLMFFYKG